MATLEMLIGSLGQYQKAIEFHEQHLQIAKEVGDRGGEGGAYGNLGKAYRSLGQYHKAIEYHEQGLANRQRSGRSWRGGESLIVDLGVCLSTHLDNIKRRLNIMSNTCKSPKKWEIVEGRGELMPTLELLIGDLDNITRRLNFMVILSK